MKRCLVLATLVTSLIVTISPRSEAQEPTAIVNSLSGTASFRQKKGTKETKLANNKDEGKQLLPNEEIRCLKDCNIELLLCTGSTVQVNKLDGWYRVPVLACERDKFVPGFRNYRLPGGRLTDLLIEDLLRVQKVTPLRPEFVQARIKDDDDLWPAFRGFGHPFAGHFRSWTLQYPYEGAIVAPQFFSLDIAGRESISGDRQKVHVIIVFTIFDRIDPLKVSTQWTKELNLQAPSFATKEGNPLDLKEVQSLLESIRTDNHGDSTRIYCTITTRESLEANSASAPVFFKPHTFGFEFYLMSNADERVLVEQLQKSSDATGIVHFLGRAQVFESMGIIKLAIDEYKKALEVYPNNEQILVRLRFLRGF